MRNPDEELAPVVTVVVTIGHNGPDGHIMTSGEIIAFRTAVALAVQKVAKAVYAHGDTHGVYGDLPELGNVWIFTACGHDVRITLRPALARLAAKYGQEAIGLIEQLNTDTLILAQQG